MGTQDTVLKDLFRDPAVFADAFNFLFREKGFHVDPDSLRELDPDQVVLSLGVDAEIEVERIRDQLRAMVSMTDDRAAYLILGIENQEKIHLAMPVQVMLKDSMQYSSQIQAAARAYKKEREDAKDEEREPAARLLPGSEFLSGLKEDDRLIPVITLVIYYGSDPWTGPQTLHKMLDWGNGREILRSFVPDYSLNLIEPDKIAPEDFSKFRTELQPLLKYIKYSGDQYALKDMMNADTAFHHMEARLVDIINKVTGSKIPYDKEQEEINVCKAIDDMIHDAVQQKDAVIQQKDAAIQQLQEQNTTLKKQIDQLMSSLTPEQLKVFSQNG